MAVVVEEKSIAQKDFDNLLAHLGQDGEDAGNKYEEIRTKLIKYFMWKGTTFPEDLADEAINRIAQKMTQYEVLGEVINNIQSFALGVARYVYQEHLRYQNITVPLETDNIKIPVDNNEDEKLKLIRSNCFEHCMSKLPSEDREVITKYYQQLGKDSEARRELAVKLDISINNLRVRVLNIRQRLSKCIEKCVEKKIIN